MKRISREFLVSTIGWDGVFTFLLSNIALVFSGGLFFLLILMKVAQMARTNSKMPTEHSDMALVLGFQLNKDSSVPLVFQQRLKRALHYQQQFPDNPIYILGGLTGLAPVSEAKVGFSYLKNKGVPEHNLVLEDASRHTLENLYCFRVNLGKSHELPKIHLISSRYHLARALAMARGLGLRAFPVAAEDTFEFSLDAFVLLMKEAYLLHWYYAGKLWSHATRTRQMLDRIS